MTFEDFIDLRLAGLLRFARVLCADRDLAEDLVQDVILRGQAKWSNIRNLDHPDAYLRRMIVNDYLSWRRRRWPVPVATVPEAPQADRFAQYDDQQQLLFELGKLPRRQRAVLVLRYYGGLDDVEIAREMGCGASTVRSHMSRGLSSLRVELAGNSAANEGVDSAHRK